MMFDVLRIKDYLLAGVTTLVIILAVLFSITKANLTAEINGRRLDAANYKSAATQSALDFTNYKNEKEKKYVEDAKKADVDLTDLRAKYSAAVLRYQTSQGGTPESGTVPTSYSGPPSSNGRSEDPLVSVPTSDLLICADNTARLETARKWALDLNK